MTVFGIFVPLTINKEHIKQCISTINTLICMSLMSFNSV